MKYWILIFIISCSFAVNAGIPDTLSLDYIQSQAKLSYPLLKQKQSMITSNLLKIKNYRTNYYPNADVSGQITYQSDVIHVQMPQPVVDLGIALPPGIANPKVTIPPMQDPDKDQYKMTLDITQSIYDGGTTRKLVEVEKLNLGLDTLKLEVDVYQIRERINQVFFNILIIQERLSLLALYKADLYIKQKSLESATKNGISTRTDLLLLQSEIIKAEQQISELDYSKQASINVLSLYIDQKISYNSLFSVPDIKLANKQILRPEIDLFSAQKTRLEASMRLLNAKKMPKLYGFGQIGYGKPGLNMFKSEPDDYYILGAKLTWNAWDWNKNKRDKQILSLQREMIQNQQETFEKNINVALENEISNVQKLTELLIKDEELIKIRKEISEYSYAQVLNGVRTMSEYLNDTNAEMNAKTNLTLHQIQLLQTKVNYNNLLGK
ncbi:MAG: TolC family protein [Bacteroidota bacterium]